MESVLFSISRRLSNIKSDDILRINFWRSTCGLVLVGLLLSVGSNVALALKVGDVAPDFELQGSDGKTHDLQDYLSQGAVVLAWFPKAYTSGCTIECKSLADNGHLLKPFKMHYFMASVDPLADNIGFAQQQQADFPLLSDPEKKIAKAYGVLSSRGHAKRHTFYIGSDGKILKIDKSVRPATSAEDMASTLSALSIETR